MRHSVISTTRRTNYLERGGTLPGRATLNVRGSDGVTTEVPLRVRIDTPIEVDYYRHQGILPFVLRQLLG